MKVIMALLLIITLISYCFSLCTVPVNQKNACKKKGKTAYCDEINLIFLKKCSCKCK